MCHEHLLCAVLRVRFQHGEQKRFASLVRISSSTRQRAERAGPSAEKPSKVSYSSVLSSTLRRALSDSKFRRMFSTTVQFAIDPAFFRHNRRNGTQARACRKILLAWIYLGFVQGFVRLNPRPRSDIHAVTPPCFIAFVCRPPPSCPPSEPKTQQPRNQRLPLSPSRKKPPRRRRRQPRRPPRRPPRHRSRHPPLLQPRPHPLRGRRCAKSWGAPAVGIA